MPDYSGPTLYDQSQMEIEKLKDEIEKLKKDNEEQKDELNDWRDCAQHCSLGDPSELLDYLNEVKEDKDEYDGIIEYTQALTGSPSSAEEIIYYIKDRIKEIDELKKDNEKLKDEKEKLEDEKDTEKLEVYRVNFRLVDENKKLKKENEEYKEKEEQLEDTLKGANKAVREYDRIKDEIDKIASQLLCAQDDLLNLHLK